MFLGGSEEEGVQCRNSVWLNYLFASSVGFFHSLMSSGIYLYCENAVYSHGWWWSRVWPCKFRACLQQTLERGRNMWTFWVLLRIRIVKQKCNKTRKRCFCVSIVWSLCYSLRWECCWITLWQRCCAVLWYIHVCAQSWSTDEDI